VVTSGGQNGVWRKTNPVETEIPEGEYKPVSFGTLAMPNGGPEQSSDT
jgi:hypothetical protein